MFFIKDEMKTIMILTVIDHQWIQPQPQVMNYIDHKNHNDINHH